MSDSFERRLAGELRAYADARTRPVDAMAVARLAIGKPAAIPWRAAMAPRLRLAALLAAAAVTLLLLGFAIGVGSNHRPLADASPTTPARSGPSLALPTPVASSELTISGGGAWWLDWESSGLTVPRAGGRNGPELFSDLTFTPNAAVLGQGAGGGCELVAAPYALDGGHLTIGVADVPSSCTETEATTAKHRLTLTASFTQGTEACALPTEMTDASTGPNPRCRTLRLLDANGQVLLVYRDIADLYGGCCLPTPDPGLLQLIANRWRLDWAASGLDGHIDANVADPILSTLDADAGGAFGVWQGYGPACDHVVGIVRGQVGAFTINGGASGGASGCNSVVTQAVRDRLANASAFFVDLENCGGGSSGAGSASSCDTLHIDDGGGDRLVYRAMP